MDQREIEREAMQDLFVSVCIVFVGALLIAGFVI